MFRNDVRDLSGDKNIEFYIHRKNIIGFDYYSSCSTGWIRGRHIVKASELRISITQYMYIVYKRIVGLAKLPISPILDTIGDLQ